MGSIWDLSPERLYELSREIERVAEAVASAPRPISAQITPATVRSIIRSRRLREEHFDRSLFADPAWDILLDLYAGRLEGRLSYVTSACAASGVPTTTALRWIKVLEGAGLVARSADPTDARRARLALTDEAVGSLEGYLAAASATSPLLT
jgi:DNA-binding MarR family transcriptional regulator